MSRTPDGHRSFKWKVEFEVSETLVADGFDLTEARALAMLQRSLQHAYGTEIAARVLKAPLADDVAKAQGYQSDAARQAVHARPIRGGS